MAEVTFRDFAAAVADNDLASATRILKSLLGLDEPRAAAAAGHFRKQMSSQGQAFMMKAMGLRTALTSGKTDEVDALLHECFGLSGTDRDTAAAALRQRYRPSA
ncbi:MAG TPA: hypothetical protein VL172_03205 [Kofleriaceae bacterium]|nr:hypothetical protein [Kofleriaceae bacterium]